MADHTIETLPDDEETGVARAETNAFDEDAFLSQQEAIAAPVADIAQPQTVTTVAPVVQVQTPVAPPTQDPAVDAAFAQQRRFYESALSMQQQATNDLHNRFAALEAQTRNAQQPAQVAPPVVVDDMPDPVDNPKEFGEWAIRQAVAKVETQVAQKIAPVEQQLQANARNQEVSAYAQSIQAAEQRYGTEVWSKLYEAAGQFATRYPSVKQDIFNTADPGQALVELGARALGVALPSNQPGPAPVAQPAQATTQMTEAQIRADERAKTARAMMTQTQNPYNLAPTSVSGIASSAGYAGGAVKPGSAEEDSLLGS